MKTFISICHFPAVCTVLSRRITQSEMAFIYLKGVPLAYYRLNCNKSIGKYLRG